MCVRVCVTLFFAVMACRFDSVVAFFFIYYLQLFRDYGFKEIDGPTFIKTLGGLAGGGARVKDADGFELHEKRFGESSCHVMSVGG